MNPKVSVIVTCYNYGDYVSKCLKSIELQTFKDFEVVVVDDGSTDNSKSEIKKFLKDKRFRYIWQKNSGQANAKNNGIKNSHGDFIAFLDADDFWEIDKLEKQLELFSSKDIGVVYSLSKYIDCFGKNVKLEIASNYLKPQRGMVTNKLIMDNFVPFSSSVIRRECIDKFGLFDESLLMGIDWDLWLRISTFYKFDYCKEPLLLYRIGHSGQMSKNLLERIECADKIYKKFINTFPDYVSKSQLRNALYYSYCSRGYALRKYGIKYILKNYIKAIQISPFRIEAFIKLIKTLCKRIAEGKFVKI